MAATRLMPLHITKGKNLAICLGERLDYCEDELKTEQKKYITAYSCDVETASEEFMLSHKLYHDRVRELRQNEIIAYQIRQSFKPGEITPEKANEIGYELAMKFTKGKHAFTVSTHTDKKQIHNHIVFNSIALDGKRKFRNYYNSTNVIRNISDFLCAENGLSIINPAPLEERKKKGNYYLNKKKEDKRLQFIVDVQKKVKETKGKGFEIWAKRFNAKQMAKTILFLQEHKIGSYEQLKELTDERNGKMNSLLESMKKKEKLLEENKKMQKAVIDYAKYRDVFVSYKKNGYSREFWEEHQSELMCYKAAEEVYKSMPGRKIPKMKDLRNQYGEILAEKKKEFLEYAQIKKDMHEYFIAKRNLEIIYHYDEDEKQKEGRHSHTRNAHFLNEL